MRTMLCRGEAKIGERRGRPVKQVDPCGDQSPQRRRTFCRQREQLGCIAGGLTVRRRQLRCLFEQDEGIGSADPERTDSRTARRGPRGPRRQRSSESPAVCPPV